MVVVWVSEEFVLRIGTFKAFFPELSKKLNLHFVKYSFVVDYGIGKESFKGHSWKFA